MELNTKMKNNMRKMTIRQGWHQALGMVAAVCLWMQMPLVAAAQEHEQWPDFPLLEITTEGGEEPAATVVRPPEGAVGISILSGYVPGRLVMTLSGDTLYDSGAYAKDASGMRIKIRGNSTGANLPQHPYKLKLSKKFDLVGADDALKDKEWALLSIVMGNTAMRNGKNNIIVYAGLSVSRMLGFPWVPRTRPVNVVLNGRYRGLYHLIETVKRADHRIRTEKSGFVIEDNAYWWKEGETYFKTDRQHPFMGFTFKYPDEDDLTVDRLHAIRDYVNRAEEAVFTQHGAADYIDYGSFARWVLAHDILGSGDSAGSNPFLYKDEMEADEPGPSKLMMATPWDFDSSFLAENGQWGVQHWSDVLFMSQLFNDPLFVEKYLEAYDEVKDTAYAYVERSFSELRNSSGKAFDESFQLTDTVYGGFSVNTFDEQVDDILTHLRARLSTLEQLTGELRQSLSATDQVAKGGKRLVKRFDVRGLDYTGVDEGALPHQIYIDRYSDGTVTKTYK